MDQCLAAKVESRRPNDILGRGTELLGDADMCFDVGCSYVHFRTTTRDREMRRQHGLSNSSLRRQIMQVIIRTESDMARLGVLASYIASESANSKATS